MLDIRNLDYFARVVRFARETSQLDHLTDVLWYLHTYAERTQSTPDRAPDPVSEAGIPASWAAHATGKRCTCDLWPDFAVASFSFALSIGLHGGLIYHGSQRGWLDSTGKPIEHYQDPFTVRIGDNPNPWSVHT